MEMPVEHAETRYAKKLADLLDYLKRRAPLKAWTVRGGQAVKSSSQTSKLPSDRDPKTDDANRAGSDGARRFSLS